MENKIDFKLPETVVSEALTAVNTALTVLKPYLIALSPAERRSLPKMNDGTQPFVQKCLEYCESDPQFVPPYLSAEGFTDDMDAWSQLMSIFRPVQQLCSNLDDTTMEAGSESYMAALSYYNSVKQAAKMDIPGAKPIYDDLKKRFSENGPKKSEPAEN
ncbi:hypothetical protein INQ51_08010 [Maribellus sp. CM-23]|uniref:hypothetical protein n=1 Tax=Maribellus sp. CM-23 TaxID=2781026 RepID=UPI001F2631C9|nr:hypothetical protein [Maribellus sp. CM-23]MCE4564254.1 hypothetical protein [Maribellus sp. CM-23]